MSSRERILDASIGIAQAHGYGGLNLRDVARVVGIKAASIYHHFPSKADLAAAVARRYWERSLAALEVLAASSTGPVDCLRRYPETFRASLASGNRICLCSFMAAEYDDLPEEVRIEVRAFSDVNTVWLEGLLAEATIVAPDQVAGRAQAIFAAVAGAQLMARGRSDLSLFDGLIQAYRSAGLLPA